ncbi:hypothetical protein H5410_032089 [Solanum commersonii]|uniref:Uncharacterized protein n=1 Tax=Solanum commersonii TaxID=4109 RepID=A0A9J5YLV4_SOLCO|nr:hypothetical protein H5410_032089 [Solanum commersonii]
MDPTINTVASSEMIPIPSGAANPSASVAIESPMEVIAHLERQVDTPLVYTFAPPKAPTVTHHAPLMYTYVTAPPVTKAHEFHRQDTDGPSSFEIKLDLNISFQVKEKTHFSSPKSRPNPFPLSPAHFFCSTKSSTTIPNSEGKQQHTEISRRRTESSGNRAVRCLFFSSSSTSLSDSTVPAVIPVKAARIFVLVA